MLWVEKGVICAAPVNKYSVAVSDVSLIVIVEIFPCCLPGSQQGEETGSMSILFITAVQI